ncbi:hypothetical protein, partial [Vibrio fluvialis]|uniref:hypothetical protein n=1 Tax=Vibrio fluvialis TaxID=676 RepID=UPI001EEAFD1B
MNQYLAVTSNGLENLLVEELTNLGIVDAKPAQPDLREIAVSLAVTNDAVSTALACCTRHSLLACARPA